MMLSDLLFIALFLVALSALFVAAWLVARKEFGRARRILFKLLVGSAVYMFVVIAVSLILPRRIVKLGEPQCFDDWCVSVDGFNRTEKDSRMEYRVDLRLSSRARRVSQRENHLAVYLIDPFGRRFDPVTDNSNVPFNVLLRPQESIVVSRSFLVPTNAVDIGAVITHEGGFPIGWFIIGYDTWFRKPPLVKLV